MRTMACDLCKKTIRRMYIFKIGFEGEALIGGSSLSWDGRKHMMERGQRRHELEVCGQCADKIVEAVKPVIGEADDSEVE